MATEAKNPDGSQRKRVDQLARVVYQEGGNPGPPAPENPSTIGKPQECADWRTPCANEAGARVETLFTKNGEPARPGESAYRKQPDGKLVLQSQTINQQVEMVEKNWPTATTIDYKGVSGAGRQDRKGNPMDTLPNAVVLGGQAPRKKNPTLVSGGGDLQSQSTGKLNPRWVEHLMGLPPGWVSPDPVGPTESTSRVDELRLLGNGVVPQTAQVAFVTLAERLRL
jgi:hypothetical protein